MPRLWISLKRSLQCKSAQGDFDVPRARNNLRNSRTRNSCKSGCSRSISNLRDVLHANKRHKEKRPCRSPRSLGSSDLRNVMTHEANPSNSTSELKIIGCRGNVCGKGGSTVMGTLKPGTPGFGGDGLVSHDCKAGQNFPKRIGDSPVYGCGHNDIFSEPGSFQELDSCCPSTLIFRKCGERLNNRAAAEAHHLSKHAVSELVEGDSSRRIVEMICRATWLKSENNHIHMKTILKVHNMQRTIAKFEDYREIVKIKASKLPTKHPRCLADGNELLRFFGTIIVCSLGTYGSSGICIMEKCGLCQILRRGFSEKEFNGGIGIFTTSTSERALKYIEFEDNEDSQKCRKALLVCRVIAGRAHKPVENFQETLRGFDSLAGKVGQNSIIEDLYLLNPKAILPCFVVICRT